MRDKLSRAVARFAMAEISKSFIRWRMMVEAGASTRSISPQLELSLCPT